MANAVGSDVAFGDVVLMRGFNRVLVGPEVEVSENFKLKKREYAVFLYLGNATRDELPSLSADKRLNDMGWTFEEDSAAVAQPETET